VGHVSPCEVLPGTKELEFYAIAPQGYKAMLGLAAGQFEFCFYCHDQENSNLPTT
jgi:hypothetical protein